MTYMHNNIFFSSLCATEQASVQDQDSTTGRIALIITPKSDSNAHLINISLIIGLIILLEAWESREERWRASDCWLPRHLSRGFKGKKKVCCHPLVKIRVSNYAWNGWFRFTHVAQNSWIPWELRSGRGEEERKKRQGEGFLRPHQSFRFCPSDASDGASKRCRATASGRGFNTDLFTRHLRLI